MNPDDVSPIEIPTPTQLGLVPLNKTAAYRATLKSIVTLMRTLACTSYPWRINFRSIATVDLALVHAAAKEIQGKGWKISFGAAPDYDNFTIEPDWEEIEAKEDRRDPIPKDDPRKKVTISCTYCHGKGKILWKATPEQVTYIVWPYCSKGKAE